MPVGHEEQSMTMTRWMFVAVSLAGCPPQPITGVCTEIGCSGQVAITVVDSNDDPVSEMAGTITMGDSTWMVDCAGTSDPGVSCSGGTITLELPQDVGNEDVTLDLHRGPSSATATLLLDWVSSQPNGPDCPPTCWTAEGSAALDDI